MLRALIVIITATGTANQLAQTTTRAVPLSKSTYDLICAIVFCQSLGQIIQWFLSLLKVFAGIRSKFKSTILQKYHIFATFSLFGCFNQRFCFVLKTILNQICQKALNIKFLDDNCQFLFYSSILSN